ncbi:MMPL family transporter [Actinacidiphila rubida]|uniref:Putative drug exporter of the RND superfamily n=1 Tax=Actinacidiphila rubida TaxID=310780 RepID=A0A1H8PVC9_9ACTN|nr:MMPL family transporter [Actinacidiphila rubida]SEO45736.1 putative drug exporter of the RND superfamily [Actinacidiphila rubida]
MNAITRLCLKNKLFVVLAWLALTVLGGLTVGHATGRLSHSFATPATAGYDANHHLLQRFGIDGNEQPTLGVLTLPAGRGMDTAAGQAMAARTFAAAGKAGHLAVADWANTHDTALVSADKRTTWAVFDMPNPDTPPGAGVMDRIEPALKAAAPAGVTVSVTGFEQIQSTSAGSGGGPSVLVETLIGAAGALAVLLFVYGSALAVVPLLIAVPAILTTFLLILGVTYAMDVSFLVEYLVAVMGLGVAVDYSLLLVTRWREEREAGRSNEEAILAAGPTAGRAVVLSGLTVAAGLLSLVILPVPFLRSVGVGGMLIPLVAIASAVTLLPVILAAWGPALDKHRVRKGSTTYSAGWERWARAIVRHRWAAGCLGLLVVVCLAVPALFMNTGQPRADSLGGQSRAAATLHGLERQGVPSAVVFPVQILSHGGPSAVRDVVRITRRTPGIHAVLAPSTPAFRSGGDALITAIPEDEGSTAAGRATVARVRAALAGVPGGVEVGGNTAQNVDFNRAVYGNFPLMLAVISLLALLLLAREFRSLTLAVKAVVVNLVSLGASFGFLVLFWQHGFGSHAVYGVAATGSIRNWIPIITFAFLFGLSMDYEVFILARMREEYDRTGSTRQAIVGALARTGRLVTCAAVILAISFASLSSAPDVVVEMIATGLGVGIFVDAVIVRTLLVPALVAIMGDWNWWLPAALARLLRVARSTGEGEMPAPVRARVGG